MRKLMLATVALSAISIQAIAADLPVRGPAPAPAPVFTAINWSGFYVGLNAGYTWGKADLGVTHLPTQAGFNADPYGVALDNNGFIGGAQIGYNFQSGSLVYGVEADLQYSNAKDRLGFGPLALFGGALQAGSFGIANSELRALGTVRARLGVTVGSALIYVTGGLAFGKIDDFSRSQYGGGVGGAFDAFNYIGTTDSWRTGYALGAGLEYAISQNWSLKGEYLYYNLGDHSVIGNPVTPNAPFQTRNNWSNDGHIARVGVNYRFGGAGPVVARY